MSNPVDFLRQIDVATPCSAKWENMTGDERSRFCGQCKKNVYNLSAMKAAEAAALIQEKEQKLCVRFYRRADGTLLTSDCPVGVRERIDEMLTKVITFVVSLAASSAFPACRKKPTGEVKIPYAEKQGGLPALIGDYAGPVEHTMGKPVAPPNKDPQ